MKKLSLFLGVVFLAVGALSDDIVPAEQLLGVTVNETGITFQVKSNGCTAKSDFNFQVQEVLEEMSPMLPAFESHHYITVERARQDSCEVFVPYGTTIFSSFEELGIQSGKFHIKNPIGGDKIVILP